MTHSPELSYDVIDLSLLNGDDIAARPVPISSWPRAKIRIGDAAAQTCIASWRRDVLSIDDASAALSRCALDGMELGFQYMLADIISLHQDDPQLIEKIIEFSQCYQTLHAVVDYRVDPDLRRPWLRHEAYKILNSPTRLSYIFERWRLSLPLIFSLTINQICTTRLGIEIDSSRLFMCDGVSAGQMRMRDLKLVGTEYEGGAVRVINLDRRNQRYASDVLLVYELSRSGQPSTLISELQALKSNSVVVPALTVIWAMMEGLSVSVRGCDWDVEEVLVWVARIMQIAAEQMPRHIALRIENSTSFILTGAIEGAFRAEVLAPDEGRTPFGTTVFNETSEDMSRSEFFGLPHASAALSGRADLLVRCKGAKAAAASSDATRYLACCIDAARVAIGDAVVLEPAALSDDAPQYEFRFDDRPHHNLAVPDGPSDPGQVRLSRNNLSSEAVALFQDEYRKAIVAQADGVGIDLSVLFGCVAAHRSASFGFALLLCVDAAEDPGALELARIIAEIWQAEFRDRHLRDIVETIGEKISAGVKPTPSEIASIAFGPGAPVEPEATPEG